MATEKIKKSYQGVENEKPNTNRLVNKVKIGFNQFRVDIRENKNLAKKEKLDSLNAQKKSYQETANSLQEKYEEGKIGARALREKKSAENLSRKIEKKTDKLQGKMEDRENKIKLLMNRRDAVAERMVSHYENKLGPVEIRLEKMLEKRNKVELLCLGNEVKIEEQKGKIEDLCRKKEDLIMRLESSPLYGENARKDPLVVLLEKQIEDIQTNLLIMKKENALKREEINSLIAKIDKKAQPYRNRRDEFIRIKKGRQIDIKLKDREYLEEPSFHEETKAHFRVKKEEPIKKELSSSYFMAKPSLNRTTEEVKEASLDQPTTEEMSPRVVKKKEPLWELIRELEEAGMEEKEVGIFLEKENIFSSWIEKYNDFIETNPEYSKEEKEALLLDGEELIKNTGIKENTNIQKSDFGKIIEDHYEKKEIPNNYYEEIINNLKESPEEDIEGKIENIFLEKENIFSSWIEKYNDFIETNPEYSKEEKISLLLNSDELIEATGLNEDIGVSSDHFRKIIEVYYKTKKTPEENYVTIISNFK